MNRNWENDRGERTSTNPEKKLINFLSDTTETKWKLYIHMYVDQYMYQYVMQIQSKHVLIFAFVESAT